MLEDKEHSNGISINYTPYSDCGDFKNWVVVSGQRIIEAKRILRERLLYKVTDPFIPSQERYLESGILIELREDSKPTMKDGWSIRLKCELNNTENLENLLKEINLPNISKVVSQE